MARLLFVYMALLHGLSKLSGMIHNIMGLIRAANTLTETD